MRRSTYGAEAVIQGRNDQSKKTFWTLCRFPDKYLNPFTDYGFKKLFGEPVNKALLLDFLNELLKEEQGEIKG